MLWGPISSRAISGSLDETSGDIVAVYAATDDYSSLPGDTPGSQLFPAALKQPLTFTRSILAGDRLGEMQTGWGEVVLDNTDGAYDYLIGGYAIDGRSITIRAGAPSESYDNFITVFDGVASDWRTTESEMIVKIRDSGARLEVPVLPTTYAGSGGAEGTSDFAGKRKPRVYGRCLNISAPLVIPTSLAYQINDGPISAVTGCYVRGSALSAGADYGSLAALLAATVAAGTYATCVAAGWARIAYASSSEIGQVTWDVHGDSTGGYVETTAGIVRRLIGAAGIGSAETDAATFAAVDAAQPAPVGIYFEPDAETTVSEAVRALTGGIGGWAGFSRQGLFQIGIVSAPEGTPVVSLDRVDIVDIERLELPSGIWPPPWRRRVRYARNWTTQTTDLAGIVTADRRAWLAEGYRTAEAAAPSVASDHPLAQDPDPVESYFADEADAQAEAARLLALYRVPRSLYRISLAQALLDRDIGEVISVTFPRWDLTGGRLLAVVEIKIDAGANTTEILGFG